MPFTLAVKLVGFIFGIGCELLFLPLAFSGPLTVFLAAIVLVFDSGIRGEDASTMRSCALNLSVHGLPPVEEGP